jgi:hypothetical protein
VDGVVDFEWRGRFDDPEVDRLHAEGFEHDLFDGGWRQQVGEHSLGWVTARRDGALVGPSGLALAPRGGIPT